MSSERIALTWLGHSAFHCAVADGPRYLVDPWITNPKAPAHAGDLARDASLILVTHAHNDHIGSTAELARDSGALVVAADELATDLIADGIPATQLRGGNRGGAVKCNGLTVTFTQAVHSSSRGADGRARSVGEPCGFIVECGNGMTLYHTGDTAIFGDMALLAEIYQPQVLLLPIGDFYTMGPRQAAKACELVNPEWIIPHHYGTFPALPGTPDALRALLPTNLRNRLLVPAPGETLSLS